MQDQFSSDLSKGLLEEIFNILVYPFKDFIKLEFDENINAPACFVSKRKVVCISLSKLQILLENNINDFMVKYNLSKIDATYYLIIVLLKHELTHARDFLISREKIEAPYEYMYKAYKYLFDLIIKDENVFLHPIKKAKQYKSIKKYYENEYQYILERNAQIEAYDMLFKLVSDIDKYFSDYAQLSRNAMMKIGYYENNKGSLYETFHMIDLDKEYNSIKFDNSIEMIERIRYGLEIPEDTRQLVLSIK